MSRGLGLTLALAPSTDTQKVALAPPPLLGGADVEGARATVRLRIVKLLESYGILCNRIESDGIPYIICIIQWTSHAPRAGDLRDSLEPMHYVFRLGLTFHWNPIDSYGILWMPMDPYEADVSRVALAP